MTFCSFLPPCFDFDFAFKHAVEGASFVMQQNWNIPVHVLCCFSAFLSCFHLWKGRSLQIEGLKGQTVNIHQRMDRK